MGPSEQLATKLKLKYSSQISWSHIVIYSSYDDGRVKKACSDCFMYVLQDLHSLFEMYTIV